MHSTQSTYHPAAESVRTAQLAGASGFNFDCYNRAVVDAMRLYQVRRIQSEASFMGNLVDNPRMVMVEVLREAGLHVVESSTTVTLVLNLHELFAEEATDPPVHRWPNQLHAEALREHFSNQA